MREHKLVHTVNRRGRDTIKTEEDRAPEKGQQSTPSKSQHACSSFPLKRQRLDDFEINPISFNLNLEEVDVSMKRHTLVSFHHYPYLRSLIVQRAKTTT